MLKIQDVTFGYKKNDPVLDRFSLEINVVSMAFLVRTERVRAHCFT